MATIHFIVHAVPIAQPRQRVTVRNGQPHTYTPTQHPVNAFKATLRMALAAAYSGAPLEGPLVLSCVFVLPRPKAKVWKTKPMPREPHLIKPDLSNLLKSTEDAMTGLAWKDDCQVFAYPVAGKWIASGNEQPHVDITFSDCRGANNEAADVAGGEA